MFCRLGIRKIEFREFFELHKMLITLLDVDQQLNHKNYALDLVFIHHTFKNGHTQCKGCKTGKNFELFWSEIGYRWLKQPGYGFDLESGYGFEIRQGIMLYSSLALIH